MTIDLAKTIVTLVLGSSGAVALFFAAYQLAIRRRAHLLELYRQAFAMMDAEAMRDARHFVYDVAREAYKTEHWLDMDVHRSGVDFDAWNQNRARAEKVARSFDQLGLLVREGLLPINILARFYASPALRCWYRLTPYINAVRSPDGRNQPGHMWEWENLVLKIIIPALRRGKGTWKGVSAHDKLEDLIQKIEHDHQAMIKDADYKPKSRPWEVAHWWQAWKW